MENQENFESDKETMKALEGVTFVTCYVNIYENEPFSHKNIPWRIEQFEFLADLGIKICVYGDETTLPYLEESAKKFPNVKIMTMDIPYKETPIYKECLTEGLNMPERRFEKKDTVEYMALMNAKIEFVNDSAVKNPWNSRIFSWVDFSMAYVFGNKGESLPYLKMLSERNFIDTFFAIPGCWQPIPPNNCSAIVNNIHWRFCGTFFIADRDSMMRFHRIYRENYPIFIREQNKLVWEVNIWAWLEANTDWGAQWYDSDHNDRIIRMPEHFFVQKEESQVTDIIDETPILPIEQEENFIEQDNHIVI
jgi:hypothetical protein